MNRLRTLLNEDTIGRVLIFSAFLIVALVVLGLGKPARAGDDSFSRASIYISKYIDGFSANHPHATL